MSIVHVHVHHVAEEGEDDQLFHQVPPISSQDSKGFVSHDSIFFPILEELPIHVNVMAALSTPILALRQKGMEMSVKTNRMNLCNAALFPCHNSSGQRN